LWLCGSCLPSWVATAPEAFLAASVAPAGTNGGGGGPSHLASCISHRASRITTSFSSILCTLTSSYPTLGLLLCTLPVALVCRAKQFGILQPIKAPDSQFPAAETPQGAVGVQRLAHGHDQTIVSLTCTVDLGACASPTSGP